MRHRIFIAINLPEKIKKELIIHQEKIEKLFTSLQDESPQPKVTRWTKKDNLHITLIFLGYVSDQELLEICKITKDTALKNKPFLIKLIKIIYGPPKKMPPRMIWVEGEKSKEFSTLKDDLEKSLTTSKQVRFSPEKRVFSPHITLGRIRTWEFRQIEPEERPAVNEEISLSFEVNSIEIMESQLKRGGSEYTVLESVALKS